MREDREGERLEQRQKANLRKRKIQSTCWSTSLPLRELRGRRTRNAGFFALSAEESGKMA